MKIHTSRLATYVDDVNAAGGNFHDPAIVEKYHPFEVEYDSFVDQALDPFSDEYFRQQQELYSEIAGRTLHQETGELHQIDISRLVNAPNPLGVMDVNVVGEQVRALSTMLGISCLPPTPVVLDMGAGQGLSSEIFAFSGARVEAVDIDPDLGELGTVRAASRGLPVQRHLLNFDDLSRLPGIDYDAAFFFQSLHHCLRPWLLIEQLRSKLKPEGVIGFVGEPIQSLWWKHWGLRLDFESMYVARSFGWFESGWSHAFIAESFRRSGMTLHFYSGGLGGGEIGIATMSDAKAKEVYRKARALGLSLREDDLGLTSGTFHSAAGVPHNLAGRPGFKQLDNRAGVLLFGPYITLEPGAYEITFLICHDGEHPAGFSFDVASDQGNVVHMSETLICAGPVMAVSRHLSIESLTEMVEVRVSVGDDRAWHVSEAAIVRAHGAPSAAGTIAA